MQLLNLMYTDSNVSNLIMYGLEGVHYRRTSAGSNTITYVDGAHASGYAGPLRALPRWAFNSTPPAFPTSYTAATKSAKNT